MKEGTEIHLENAVLSLKEGAAHFSDDGKGKDTLEFYLFHNPDGKLAEAGADATKAAAAEVKKEGDTTEAKPAGDAAPAEDAKPAEEG